MDSQPQSVRDARRICELEMKIALASQAIEAGDVEEARRALATTPDIVTHRQGAVNPVRQPQGSRRVVRRRP